MSTATVLPVVSTITSRFRAVRAVIVKVTHRCNLDCAYCYEHITAGQDMSLHTFRSMVDEVFASTQEASVTLIFHGGEPTLLPVSFYRDATAYATEVAHFYGKRVEFCLQTNLINVTPDKLAALRECDIRFSVSLDGPDTILGSMRPGAKSAMQAFERARALGFNLGVLMTINHSNYAHFSKITRWLDHEVGIRDFKANAAAAVGRGRDLPNLSAYQIHAAHRDIMEYMVTTKGERVIEENLLTEVLRFFAPDERDRGGLCGVKRCGAGQAVIGVSPHGAILPCGRFSWDDHEYVLGNISETSPDYDERVERFHALSPQNWYDCDSCDARRICSFGCQAFIVRSKAQANVECLPTKMLYQYMTENRTRIEELAEAVMKLRHARHNGGGASAGAPGVITVGQDYKDYKDYKDYSDRKYSDYSDKKDSTYKDVSSGSEHAK